MTGTGKTFKRCGCRNNRGQRLEQNCPELADRGHGTWYFHCFAPNLLGRSERIRRGGYPSQTAARHARDDTLADRAARRTGDGWTVERWLRHWLDTRTRIRPTTRLAYTRDVELVLIPHLGHYRLSELDGPLLRAVFADIAGTTNAKGKPQSASALTHLRTTLRAALNLAVREELIESNPARHIEIHGYRRPHARSGPKAASNSGNAPANTPPSPSGPPSNSAASSRASSTTRCSPSGGSPPCAGYAAVNSAA